MRVFLNLFKIELIYKKSSVPFRGPPRYNPRRRSGLGWGATLSRIGGPPSPCPSEHPFSSASSSLSEGSSSHRSHEDDISIVTGIFQLLLYFLFKAIKDKLLTWVSCVRIKCRVLAWIIFEFLIIFDY